ncbi:MAG: choice-of-anchor D domain-containing protein [Actinobacteria bacterium]|nr:choice-of-anchor D domain-containing protein [Actinomycetota bacterium]
MPDLTVPLATVTANSVTQHCLLEGNVWGEGNILLGGGGADVLEGRGADDVIDGDRYLAVRLSVRTNVDGTGPELGTTTLMEKIPTGTGWTGPLAGKTLQQAVFAGLVNPGQIVAVREIVTAPAGSDLDTARFAGNRAEFTITDLRGHADDPRIIVDHNAPDATRVRVPNDCPTAAPGCGVDIVRNVERLEFLDQTVAVGTPVASLSTTALDFGTRSTVAAPFTRPVNITNTGNGNLTVTGATVTGADAGLFTVTNGCTTVVPGATCTVSVAFRTTTTGAKSATLSIAHNAAGSPSTVALTGAGVVNTAATGLPAVDDATPTEGSAVTATTALVADADGLVGTTFSAQWQFSNAAGTTFTNIAGATGLTFTPAQAQVGRRLQVVVTFVDNHGSSETRTSSPTGVVGDLFPGPGETNAGANTRNGTTGDDVFAGGPGADSFTMGAGDDQVSGDAGNDTVNTGGGNDRIFFSGVGDGFDAVTGGADADRIEARTPGTDIGLQSVNGVETITGNGFANVRIVGTTGAEVFNFNNVTLTDITSINGGGGADNMTGSQAADVIIGGAAVDTINGQDGDDVIEGGAGNDVLNGQVGNDQFRYTAAFNADTVNGFDTNPAGGQDQIDLRGVGVTPGNFATRVTISVVNATTTLVTVNGVGGTIRLNNVAAASVNATDFILS